MALVSYWRLDADNMRNKCPPSSLSPFSFSFAKTKIPFVRRSGVVLPVLFLNRDGLLVRLAEGRRDEFAVENVGETLPNGPR